MPAEEYLSLETPRHTTWFIFWAMTRRKQGTPASWAVLAQEVLALKPSGQRGFEGLVAGWLSRLLGEPFYVAASGRQASGDAASHSLEIGMQAKRYKASKLRANEIRGDIASQSAFPDLQVYVLASTKSIPLDLHRELTSQCDDLGIGFVFLGLSSEGPSDLGVLGVTFWPEVTSSFLGKSSGLSQWATAQRKRAEVASHIEDLRARVAASVGSKQTLARRSCEQVVARLFPVGIKPPSGTSLDSSRMVERPAICRDLDQWWSLPERPLFVVGEEGLGKSWALAAWLRSRGGSLGLPIVWLDSHRWHTVRGLNELAEKVAVELCEELVPLEAKARRILRKLTSRLPPPVCLLVLDGANEGDAQAATIQILKEYLDEAGQRFAERFKLVLTTRPPEAWLPRKLHEACAPLSVGPFTPDELDEAIRKATAGEISAQDLPGPLREFARRARYLELCLELRDRLGGFSELSVETVLFVRLKKLVDENAAFLGLEGGLGVFAEIVRLTSPQAGFRVLEDVSALNKLVRDGASALRELQDVGWIQELEGGRRVLTPTHVQLAWALFFLQFAGCQRLDAPLTQRIEGLRTVQEPGLDDDLRSHALGTALELLASGLARRNSFAAASLLGAWVLSHNTHLQGPTFARVLEAEPKAYCEAIEALVTLTGELHWEDHLTNPLAGAWRSGGETARALQPFLHRWLLLVWDESEAQGPELVHDGVRLPRVPTWRALNLENLSIGILANRPDPALLRTLCRQAGSWDLSRDRRGRHYKDHLQWVGALMRWGFGEAALPKLGEIAADPASVAFEVKGARHLAEALWQRRLPPALHQPQLQSGRHRRLWFEIDLEALRKGKPGLLSTIPVSKFGDRRWPEQIAVMAADRSVPDLHEADLLALELGLESLARDHELWEGRMAGNPEEVFEVWLPWLARQNANAWTRIVTQLAEKAARSPHPRFLLAHVPALVPLPAESRLGKLLPREIRRTLREVPPPDLNETRMRLVDLTRMALQLEDRQALCRYLSALSRANDAAWVLKLLPVLSLLRDAVDRELFEEANRQLAKHPQKPARHFWLSIQSAFARSWPSHLQLAWLAEVVKFAGDSEDTGILLLDFLLDIDDPSVLQVARENPHLRDLLETPYFRAAAVEWARWQTTAELPESYDTLVEHFLLQSLGPWLLAAGRLDDFRQWGKDLFAAMTALAEQSSDRGRQAPWVEWSEGLSRRRGRVVTEDRGFFESGLALAEWARREPREFLERMAGFRSRIRDPLYRFEELADFASAAAEAWMVVEPRPAYDWLKVLLEGTNHSYSVNGIPSAVYLLWNLKVCSTPEHQELRRHLLATSRNDAEIASHAFAARMHQALPELDSIIGPLLKSAAQLDRVLAVALLAWHPQGEKKLARLESRDPSRWVRNLAAWAYEVCRRDQLGRETYRKALCAEDALHQQALLHQVAPLLLPSFHVWRLEDRSLVELEAQLSPQRRALLVEFKHRAKPADLSRSTCFGRNLAKYCRGEKLDGYMAGLGRQLLPWW